MVAGGFRISLEGDARLIDLLAALNETARTEAKRALQESVDVVKNRAIAGIADGPKTGRVYTTHFATSVHGGVFTWGTRPAHQASAPGEYPAADTGNLMRSIWAEVDDFLAGLDAEPLDAQLDFNLLDVIRETERLRGTIGADAEYAAPLEYKTPDRGGRPFLRRALAESADDIERIFLGLRGRFGGGGNGGGGGAPSPTPAPAPRPPRPAAPAVTTDALNRAELDRIRNLPPLPPP